MKTKQVAIKDVQVGDLAMGVDGKPHKITHISPWARTHYFIAIDGTADGYYRAFDEVAIVVRG